MAFLNACGGGATETVTNTVTKTSTVTTTASGGTGVVTTTVTSPPVTVTSPPTTVTVTTTPPAGATNLTTFTVNGAQQVLANLDPGWSLMYVLREKLGLVGTKNGCNRGECGTCTVIMNGKAVYSCVVLAVDAEGAQIQTIEGLSDGMNFTGIMKAIYDGDSLQCGYCAPGFIMAAKALLDAKAKPTLDDVRTALSGHICTCGNIKLYVDAVLTV
jgi:aerobic-type carbon monoxide dehydrogenase small subunit (CoxS/CutS family)